MAPLAIIRKIYFITHTRSLRLHGGYPKSCITRFDPSVAETFTSYDYKKFIKNGNKWAINFISYLLDAQKI